MATKNIVPNDNGEGGIGVTAKRWSTAFINTVTGNVTGNLTGQVLTAAQTNINSILATDLIIGEDAQTAIDFGTVNEIDFKVDNANRLTLTSSVLAPATTNQIDLGTSSLEFKDAFFDGTVTADAFAGPLTGNVTGNASGTAATVTGAAQSNITSLGTLTTLTVDSVIVNGTTIGHTSDTDLLTLADQSLTIEGTLTANGTGNHAIYGDLYLGGNANLVVQGANSSHTASSIKVSQENTTLSEIRCYGADDSTNGAFQLKISSSAAASEITPLKIESDGVMISSKGIEFEGTALATGQSGISSSGNGGELRLYTNGNQAFTFGASGSGGDLTIAAGNLFVNHSTAELTINNNADSTSGGTLSLENTDTSVADNHESGRIYFYGQNDGALNSGTTQRVETVLIRGMMTDVSDGTEDSKLELMTMSNGGQVTSLNIAGNDSTFSGTLTANGTLKTGTATTVSPESVADDFIIDPGVASVGMSIMGSGQCAIKFGDAADADVGGITYVHGSDNEMIFTAGATNTASIVATGVNITGQMYSTSVKVNDLGSGDVFSTGAGILTNSDPSDSRLKTNIENIDYGLSEILKLRSIKFNWLNGDKNSKKQFGFIAQEVKEIIPESVSEFDYDGDQRFGLEKNAIYVGLVKAIQEQQVIIEDLKSRIETLEG